MTRTKTFGKLSIFYTYMYIWCKFWWNFFLLKQSNCDRKSIGSLIWLLPLISEFICYGPSSKIYSPLNTLLVCSAACCPLYSVQALLFWLQTTEVCFNRCSVTSSKKQDTMPNVTDITKISYSPIRLGCESIQKSGVLLKAGLKSDVFMKD